MAQETRSELAHYRLVEKLGEGGMGIVWRALDSRLGREVAIKLLPEALGADPQRLARFEREARVIAALNHPGIVTIHSIEQHGETRFLTMELVPGRTLAEAIPPGGFPFGRLIRLAVPICDAVAAAHQSGIAHGDLKPTNVMVTDEDRVKVLDFGLARPAEAPPPPPGDPSDVVTRTEVGGVGLSGTIPYMSPEHLLGRPVDARSDVFSLGVVLYEMACGRRPFGGATAPEIAASILRDVPRSLAELRPELPRQLDRLVRRCLEKDPARRFPSAVELRADLEALGGEAGVRTRDDVPSIAVLPFADMSPTRDQDYFCEGIAEEILNALTRIRDLRVVSRISSFQFRQRALDVREIGDRLGVSALLDGSVRKAGDRIRVTAELIDVADGFQLWSERYDREIRDVFAIQEEIARRIVEALAVELSPRERRAIKQVATADVEAYEYHLRGRKYYHQYGRRAVEYALGMFSRAIEIDPKFALAWAGVADCCAYLYLNAGHDEACRARAEQASDRALELDPDLAEAHTARGLALSLSGSRDAAAVEAFETAIRLNPRLFEAHYFYARHCFARGDAEAAIRLYGEAARVRPEDYQSLLLVAQIHDDQGRSEEAAASRREGVRRAEARLDLVPDDVRALYMGANGLVALGQLERGLEWAGRARSIEPDEPMLLYNLACIYALAAHPDEALVCLERAVALGFAHRDWLERDSNLDSVRTEPRFAAILARLA